MKGDGNPLRFRGGDLLSLSDAGTANKLAKSRFTSPELNLKGSEMTIDVL
jgi:hypothetical protein